MPPRLQQRRERAAPRNHPRADEQRRLQRAAPRNEFVGAGFAAVLAAVSFLNLSTVGGGDGPAVDESQVILTFALLAAGLLSIMHGMRRARDAQAPPFVRRAADAVGAVLWDAGGRGPERLLPLVVLLLCPLLEAWFDFI